MLRGGCEIYQTNYPHPDIKHGQHTNGPARVWVKVDGKRWKLLVVS